MCKSRLAVMASRPTSRSSSSVPITDSGGYPRTTASNSSSPSGASLASKTSSSASLLALRNSLQETRDSLQETPTLYPFSEISAATKNFVASSSSSSRPCSLRGKDAVVFRRPFRGDPAALPARLAAVCKSHHSSLVRLLGASLAGGSIYLVYEHSPSAPLADCLRNPRNPNFTPLSSWMSRIQVAADLAQGLDYIHQHSGTIHNRIKASNVLVTEPHFRAKICHFGAADLAGEILADAGREEAAADAEISPLSSPSPKLKRSDSRRMKIEGTRGYMAPELLAGGSISRRSDVYALGVVLLELLSGEEPIKYRFDKGHNSLHKVSLIETAREAIGPVEDSAEHERRGRVRRWVDLRLRDSYPVDAAEDLIRVALRCVEEQAAARPDMTFVAGKVSQIFLHSKAWEERLRVPTDFSVSFAPR
ncbi:lysM domain receptor-like kinase 3 [Elaeis guineensis]|uniref:LysM domain receptor-like kinase 3 isoform X1 n=1 Tax=Elaeis guineensis var. tenera TaxID=51953 RepID=A0A6I9S0V8_ELAGV|nr:lysM domain receptor-like kinase 3 isoform X1 [Elaeis guineensis]